MTSQDKKKILLQFEHIDEHIKELKTEAEQWWERASLKSPNISGMPKAQSLLTAQQRALEHLETILKQIDDETDRLLILRSDLMKSINQLNDIRERRVLYLKYIGKSDGDKYKRLTLNQIARVMHYSEIRVKQIHGHALFHIEL